MPDTAITLTEDVSRAIDRFIAAQEVPPSRDDAVNGLLRDWLTAEGHLPPEECPPEVAAAGDCE